MNNNNFMKAMSMIDEDLIKEADTPYTDKAISDNSTASFGEDENSTVVSGVDVYHRTAWRKFLGIAAALVIALGAVGGGVYHFSRLRNNNIEERMQYDSIYDKLKANRNKYKMDDILCLFDKEVCAAHSLGSQEQQRFFEYMDQLEMKTVIDEGDFAKTAKSLRFVFWIDEENLFVFDVYNNGNCTWKEKSNGRERTTYHSFSDCETAYKDLSNMYSIEDSLRGMEFFVESEEIKGFIDESYTKSFDPTSSLMNTAIKHEGSKTEMYEFEDRDQINEIILSCDWVRADDFDFNDYYIINGISLSEDGYMAGYYNGYYVVYKPRKTEYLDKLSQIWQTYMKNMNSQDINEVWQQISSETTVKWQEGPMYEGQGKMDYDNINYYYHFSDSRSFADEIMSLEWDKCDSSEWDTKVVYQNDNLYVSDGYYTLMNIRNYEILSLSPGGYMNINDLGCYKLKNEADIEKLDQLFDKYLIMDKRSVIAQKICKGITDFDNLKAHYTFELSYNGEDPQTASGNLSVDARNEKMYMTGEGIYVWGERIDVTSVVVMNGHDDSAFRITDKETNEDIYSGLYHYSNGNAIPPPEYHYIYLCKDIENRLSPRYTYYEKEYKIEEREVGGNTEVTVHINSAEDYYNYNLIIVLNEKGQLISYDFTSGGSHILFKLDDYVFDSPDFTMEDVGSVYEGIKAEKEEQ